MRLISFPSSCDACSFCLEPRAGGVNSLPIRIPGLLLVRGLVIGFALAGGLASWRDRNLG